MTVRPTPRLTVDGETLSDRVWAIIDLARERAKVPEARSRVVQGSWAHGAQSAGTHAGGGVFDLSAIHLGELEALRLVGQLRILCGGPVWLRSPKYGWPEHLSGAHIHGAVRDEPGLAIAARQQVSAWDAGRNGLAAGAEDPFPRPKWEPFRLWGTPADYPGAPLRVGSEGPAVRDLQRALEILPDGQYGPRTKARVLEFQRPRGELWPLDGVVGPKTYAAALAWGWR